MNIQVAVYVRLGNGKTLTSTELKSFASERITHWKVPKYIKFVDSYPTTISGKVQKMVLREMAIKDFDLKN